jgi:hypothetical protein
MRIARVKVDLSILFKDNYNSILLSDTSRCIFKISP